MNKGAPPDSICLVRKVRFFPAPPEILKRRSVTPVSGALVLVAQIPRSRSGAGRRTGQVLALQVVVGGSAAAAAGGASARSRCCRWWRTWPAARAPRRAGQVPVLQVVVDVASSSMRPPAVRRPGGGAAGDGGRGQQLDAPGGGALARCQRCRSRWTWPAARGGRWRRAGQVLALQVMVDVASSSRRPPAVRWPGASAAGRGDRGLQFTVVGGAPARL